MLHERTGVIAWVKSLPGASILWLGLWFSINTGPWQLKRMPTGLLDTLHTMRAAFPLVVLFLVALVPSRRYLDPAPRIAGPVKMWLVYGVIGLLACTMSPRPLDAAYWGVAYLATFAVLAACMDRRDLLGSMARLNQFNWLVTAAFLAILVVVARDALFVGEGYGITGYGVVSRVGSVGEMAMSRSSGMARFAAVPGVAAFVLMWQARWIKKAFWAVPFSLSGAMIYLMQSRGAIVGFAFAVSFVLLFLSSRTRLAGVMVALLLVLAIIANAVPEEVLQHITRGASVEQLETMTGRTRTWENAWREIKRFPVWVWGGGPQADRFLIHEHAHNTYIYAMLEAGLLGTTAFVAGLIWAWVLFYRAIKSGIADFVGQRTLLIQAGGILAFFTVRSITEVSGPMFGVDTMVMLPILGYLWLLERERKKAIESGPLLPDGPWVGDNQDEYASDRGLPWEQELPFDAGDQVLPAKGAPV